MSSTKFELNTDGIGQLLKSSEAVQLCESFANQYGGEVRSFVGFDRAHAIVYEEKEERGNND